MRLNALGLIREIAGFLAEYRWAENIVHAQQVTESAGRSSGTSDRTKQTAFDHDRLKGEMADAVHDLVKSWEKVTRARSYLRAAIEADEKKHYSGIRFEKAPTGAMELRHLRRLETNAVAESRVAQRKRAAAGSGYGAG